MTESNHVACASRIDRVTLYARGAVVTRVVTLPEALPRAQCTLALSAGSPLFDPRSLRAVGAGTRAILAVDAQLTDRSAKVELGPLAAEIEAQKRALEALRERKARWAERQSGLLSVWPDPRLRPRRANEDGGARVRDALSVGSLTDALVEGAHREIEACESAEKSLMDAIQALELRYAQASSASDGRDVARSLSIRVQLAEATAEDALTGLEIEYIVDAARWWPAYKVRLSEGARAARWSLDAYIAQSTGEDWSDVIVSLSTADLVRDVRLPTLPSLRLGRAQPPKRAYRPPPQGLDELFAGYDGERSKSAAAIDTRTADIPAQTQAGQYDGKPMPKSGDVRAAARHEERDERKKMAYDDEGDGGAAKHDESDAMVLYSLKPASALGAAPMAEPMMPIASQSRGGGAFGRRSDAAPPEKQKFATVGGDLDPDEQWLDYDGLTLADPRDSSGSRGRLAKSSADPFASVRGFMADTIEQKTGPQGTVDPRAARGMFDHRYDGTLRVDVLSDGALHRVSVAQGEGHSKPKFRVVAKEAQAVYREAEVQNPFDAPLLGGPAEVFFDDALIARAQVAPGDRGSTIALGLGLEERIRVARNGQVRELKTGVVVQTTVVEHHVTIELSSSLGEAVTVDVIDRVPTAKSGDEIEVSLESSSPKAQVYTQAERGAPIEGGLKWSVELAAGAKASIAFAYSITLSSKLEVEGGNRRD